MILLSENSQFASSIINMVTPMGAEHLKEASCHLACQMALHVAA